MSEADERHLVVARTARTGKGLFTQRAFKRHEIVLELRGELKFFVSRTAADAHMFENWIGIGKDRWIDPAEPFVYLNHSCEPNLSVRGKREMIALRDIAAGEELTFDYSITVDELPWTMDCLCATPSCRKVVRAIQFLPPDMVASYLPYINPYFVDCHTYYRVVRRLA